MEHYFSNISRTDFSDHVGFERVVNGTGLVITSLVDECLRTPEDLFVYVSEAIDFFGHLTSDRVKTVLYQDIKLIVDTVIKAFKVVYEKHDSTEATEMIGDLLRKVIE